MLRLGKRKQRMSCTVPHRSSSKRQGSNHVQKTDRLRGFIIVCAILGYAGFVLASESNIALYILAGVLPPYGVAILWFYRRAFVAAWRSDVIGPQECIMLGLFLRAITAIFPPTWINLMELAHGPQWFIARAGIVFVLYWLIVGGVMQVLALNWHEGEPLPRANLIRVTILTMLGLGLAGLLAYRGVLTVGS